MVTEIRLHFEGANALREGFHEFLKEIVARAREKRIKFRLRPCGADAPGVYQTAVTNHQDAINILLRDSEGAQIPNPPKENEFWMVQMMEAWFLADPDALAQYYGKGFKKSALKRNPNVEEIPKADVLSSLKRAAGTRPYHKTIHAPHILQRLDPAKVRRAAPNCDRLFQEVLAELAKLP